MIQYIPFIIICLLTCAQNAPASALPQYNVEGERFQLRDFEVGLIADPERSKSIEEIAALAAPDTLTSSRFQIHSTGANYWFIFRVRNNASHPIERIVRFDEVYMEEADIYYRNGSAWHHEQNGLSQPLRLREVQNRAPVFSLTLEPGESRTLYLKLHSKFILTVGILVESPSIFLEGEQWRIAGYWFYFGAALIIMIYNLFLFLYLRERVYAYYIFYGVNFILFIALYSGYSLYVNTSPAIHYMLHFSIALTGAGLALFTRELLNIKAQFPRINRLLLLICGLFCTIAVLIVIDIRWYLGLVILGIVAMPMLFVVGVFCVVKKVPLSWFYLFATSSYLWGLSTIAAVNLSLVPYNLFTRYGSLIGSLLELSIFSLALAYRVRRLQDDKLRVQQKLLTAEQRLKNDLEDLVKKRTEELERQNHELVVARQRAEVANQTKSTFLANMSHELRTPLNAILGFTQIMGRNPQLPGEEQEYLGIIRRSGEHLLTLINQVLDLSKIEAGRITLNPKSFDLHEFLDEQHDIFSLKARDKGVSLSFERGADVPRYVSTDEVKLRQVLMNLLSNAIKFTEHGSVTLSVSRTQYPVSSKQEAVGDKQGLPTANCQEPTAYCLLFTVEDTGPGIIPEEMHKLFEAFGQSESGRNAQEGTGLGLPISRKFAQLMGGDITIESAVERGTIVRCEIQVEHADEPEIARPRHTQTVKALAPNQGHYRVLIVDDKPDNRSVLVKLLKPFGFELREAKNGQEAVDVWKEWKPQLIWMDLRMPVMDGYKAAQFIRKAERGSAVGSGTRQSEEQSESTIDHRPFKHQTVIIVLSASSIEEERTLALSKGCDDFLRKPFHDTDIFELMRQHLGLRFVYDNALEPSLSSVPEKTQPQRLEKLAAALASLPSELYSNLENAATLCDIEAFERLNAEVHNHNSELAKVLKRFTDNFDFMTILEAIQQRQKQ